MLGLAWVCSVPAVLTSWAFTALGMGDSMIGGCSASDGPVSNFETCVVVSPRSKRIYATRPLYRNAQEVSCAFLFIGGPPRQDRPRG